MRKQYLKISIVCFAIAIVAYLFMGCATMFDRIEVVVPSFKVIFCPPGDSYLPKPYVGLAAKHKYGGSYTIFVFGEIGKDGKVTTNLEHLGHELMHILNWEDDRIANPDRWKQ